MQLRNFLIFIFLSFSLVSFGAKIHTIYTVPTISKTQGGVWVSNPEKIISDKIVKELNEKISTYEKQSSREIAVVALRSIGGERAETFVNQLFKRWKLGKKELASGLLILYVEDKDQVVFALGDKLKLRLSDDICLQIEQFWIAPLLTRETSGEALLSGVEGFIQFLDTGSVQHPIDDELTDRRDQITSNSDESIGVSDTNDEVADSDKDSGFILGWGDFVIVLAILLFCLYRYLKRPVVVPPRVIYSSTLEAEPPAIPASISEIQPVTSSVSESKSITVSAVKKPIVLDILVEKDAIKEESESSDEMRDEAIERQRKRDEDREADGERERQRAQERGVERERELERLKERQRERELEREQEQERTRERERERERQRDRGERTTW